MFAWSWRFVDTLPVPAGCFAFSPWLCQAARPPHHGILGIALLLRTWFRLPSAFVASRPPVGIVAPMQGLGLRTPARGRPSVPTGGGCDEAVAQACGLRGHRMVRGGAHPDRRRRRVANAGRRFLVPRDPLAQQPSVARLWFNIARTVVLDGSGGLSVSSQSTSVQYTLAGVALVSGDAHALVQCMHARCL